MLLDWADARPGAYELWRANGGLETLTSYPDTRVPPEHFAFYRSTVLAHEAEGFAFEFGASLLIFFGGFTIAFQRVPGLFDIAQFLF